MEHKMDNVIMLLDRLLKHKEGDQTERRVTDEEPRVETIRETASMSLAAQTPIPISATPEQTPAPTTIITSPELPSPTQRPADDEMMEDEATQSLSVSQDVDDIPTLGQTASADRHDRSGDNHGRQDKGVSGANKASTSWTTAGGRPGRLKDRGKPNQPGKDINPSPPIGAKNVTTAHQGTGTVRRMPSLTRRAFIPE